MRSRRGVQLHIHIRHRPGCCRCRRRHSDGYNRDGLHDDVFHDIPPRRTVAKRTPGIVPPNGRLRESGFQDRSAHEPATDTYGQRTDSEHGHRGSARQHIDSGKHVRNHSGEHLLHAGLRHSRGRHHARGTGTGRRTPDAHPQLRPSVGGTWNDGDDTHGGTHVRLRTRDDGYNDSRGRHTRTRHRRTAHRGVRRTDVCGGHRLLRRIRGSGRHAETCHHEPCQHVGRQVVGRRHPRPALWPARSMGSHGDRTDIPWRHIPHPTVQRRMDGNDKERRTVKKGKRAGLKIPTLQAPEALIDMKERIPEHLAVGNRL